MKSVHIRSYSGLYSVRMSENTDQNNSEYGLFLRSDSFTAKRFNLVTDLVYKLSAIYLYHHLRKKGKSDDLWFSPYLTLFKIQCRCFPINSKFYRE